MQRRELMQFATLALGGIASPGLLRAAAADGLRQTSQSSSLLSADQRKLLATLCEIIIPTTTTPGAITAGVPAFIETILAEWYTDTERQIFIQGFADCDEFCSGQYQRAAADCNAEQLMAMLTAFEKAAAGYTSPGSMSIFPGSSTSADEHTPFFTKLKELTVVGYFTSEVGVTQSLAYNPMPMEYKGDIALEDVDGKQWAQY